MEDQQMEKVELENVTELRCCFFYPFWLQHFKIDEEAKPPYGFKVKRENILDLFPKGMRPFIKMEGDCQTFSPINSPQKGKIFEIFGKANLRIKDFEMEIEEEARIFENGCGSFRVELVFPIEGKNNYIFDEIYEIVYLGIPDFFNCEPFLYQSFKEFVEGLCARNDYNWIGFHVPTKILEKEKRVEIIGKEREQYPTPQEPYFALLIGLAEEQYDKILLNLLPNLHNTKEKEKIKKQREILLKTLLRSKEVSYREVKILEEMKYLYKINSDDWKFLNYSIAEPFFVTFGFKGSLNIYRSPKQNKYDDYWKQLREIYSAIFVQYFSYGIASAWLDKRIQEIGDAIFSKIKKSKPQEIIDIIKTLLEGRIEEKILFLRIFEDPITYTTGSTSIDNFFKRGLDIFRLDVTEKRLVEKCRLLDRVYDEILDYLRLKKLTEGGKRKEE